MVRDIEAKQDFRGSWGDILGESHVMMGSPLAHKKGEDLSFLLLLETFFAGVAHLDALAPF